MSLEYITIHNCLPRAGGVYMVQTCHHNQMHACTHAHTVALPVHLDIITRYSFQRETIADISVARKHTTDVFF